MNLLTVLKQITSQHTYLFCKKCQRINSEIACINF